MILTHGANSLNRVSGGQTANIGGRDYRIVEMPDGNIWMAENLDYKFSGLIVGSMSTSYSDPLGNYYDNDETNYGIDGTYKCGLLYNFAAVKYLNDNREALCPGWHVPSISEWDYLVNIIDENAGQKLKAIDGSAGNNWPQNWNGTDIYGFNGLPSGYREWNTGIFKNIAIGVYYWTSSKYDSTNSYNRNLVVGPNTIRTYSQYSEQQSIRLIKD